MEPITHFLTGACLARSGFNRKTALATATMTLAAEAPDLDVLGNLKGPVFGFAHHRGFTHSFLGLILVASVVVGLLSLIWRWRGKTVNRYGLSPRWALLFLLAYLAGLTHILLDYTNAYGVRPFWPFSEKWYSWNIVSLVDPWLLVLLVAGLVVPAFFTLISEEIGERRKGPTGYVAAAIALIGMLIVWGLRDYEHRRAVNALEARLYEGADPLRASAFPSTWSPFRWSGVVETQNFFTITWVDSLAPEVDPGAGMQIRFKPQETAATITAKRTYLGRVYLDWAEYPITETENLPDGGFLVRFLDLRYVHPDQAHPPLSARVFLDASLREVKETFGFRQHGIPTRHNDEK